MGERYYITGVQLGMMIAFLHVQKIQKVEAIISKILKEQYLGQAPAKLEVQRNK